MVNRLAIMPFYDKDGIIDEKTKEYIKEIKKNVSRLIFVVNGNLSETGQLEIKRYVDEVLIRENTGLDAGAIKYCIQRLKKEYINKFDELLIVNSTCELVSKSLSQLFVKMEGGADFWGITSYEDVYFPKHLQSYFLLFTKRVLEGNDFYNFWDNYRGDDSNKNWVIAEYEIGLSIFLQTKGYKMAAYLDYPDHNVFFEKDFFVKKGIPIVKRNAKPFDDRDKSDLIPEHTYSEIVSSAKDTKRVFFYGITTSNCFLARSLMSDKEVGFVVSDELFDKDKVGNISVYKFSEISDTKDTLLVVGLGHKNRSLVEKNLETRFSYIYYLFR